MGNYPNRGKKQYGEREKQAFHAGRGYAAGKANKRVKCKTEKEKESFRNGVKSVRGNKKSARANKKPEIVAGITADGELVKLN